MWLAAGIPDGSFCFINDPNQLDQFLVNATMAGETSTLQAAPASVQSCACPEASIRAATPSPDRSAAWATPSTRPASPTTSPSAYTSRRPPEQTQTARPAIHGSDLPGANGQVSGYQQPPVGGAVLGCILPSRSPCTSITFMQLNGEVRLPLSPRFGTCTWGTNLLPLRRSS
jgi:hypothetical protein